MRAAATINVHLLLVQRESRGDENNSGWSFGIGSFLSSMSTRKYELIVAENGRTRHDPVFTRIFDSPTSSPGSRKDTDDCRLIVSPSV